MRVLYVCDRGDHVVTHDGNVQLGVLSQTLAEHRRLRHESIAWLEVNWVPDIFNKRYKRVNFQKHMVCNEGSPKTDHAGDSRPRDCPETTELIP